MTDEWQPIKLDPVHTCTYCAKGDHRYHEPMWGNICPGCPCPLVAPVTHPPLPPDLLELTYEQRQALPAKFHQPHWMGLTQPRTWICAVCWDDDGTVHGWPCDVANAGDNGLEIANTGGMRVSW